MARSDATAPEITNLVVNPDTISPGGTTGVNISVTVTDLVGLDGNPAGTLNGKLSGSSRIH